MLQIKPIETSIQIKNRKDSPSSDRSVVVEVRNLSKTYGHQLAVKDVSFSFHGGEVLGLLGPNGAGKSTAMMMITGLLASTSGEVIVNGEKYDGRRLRQRRLFGIVPQEYAIYQDLSALSNLMFFGRLYGLRGKILKTRCDEVLDQIGLTEHANRKSATYSGGMKRRLNFGIALIHKPQILILDELLDRFQLNDKRNCKHRALSGGMKKRLLLCRALVHDPEILILDEPTLGVDPQSRFHLMECINRQTAEGGSVLYASHYMEEAQSICQRVVILDHGEVIADDSIHNLLAGLAADVYLHVDRTTGINDALIGLARIATDDAQDPAVVVSGNPRISATESKALQRRTNSNAATTATGPVTAQFASRLQATLAKLQELKIQVLSVETQQSNLERVFLNLTGKALRD